jgi:DNA-binding NtrC family response regulator
MQHADIALASLSQVPVLITGEDSEHRRACARSIHDARKPLDNLFGRIRPFVAVSCDASRKHDRAWDDVVGRAGATAADLDGWLAKAKGGTLFVDDIEHMGAELQQQFSSALDSLNVLGDAGLEVRVITGAKSTWPTALDRQQFSERLYYRLNTIRFECIALPQVDVPERVPGPDLQRFPPFDSTPVGVRTPAPRHA